MCLCLCLFRCLCNCLCLCICVLLRFLNRDELSEKGEGKYLEKISPKIVKDIEKSRFWYLSRDFCQFLQGFFYRNLVQSVQISRKFGSDENCKFPGGNSEWNMTALPVRAPV